MGAIKDLLSALMIDATPEERARTLRVLFRIIVSVHILWACGLLTPFGASGFVFAKDVDVKVQNAIVTAVEPLRTDVAALKSQVNSQDDMLREIRMDQIAARLRELLNIRCTTKDERVRDRVDADIEEAQRRYRALSGERYPLGLCEVTP